MLAATWAQLAGTVFLGLVGLRLAHNYRRQLGLKLADRLVDSYQALWALTSAAAVTRTTPLDQAERQKMREDMLRWYFEEGNALFVSSQARDLFMAIQSNLTCPIESIRPPALAADLAALPEAMAERRRGCVCIRHLLLLRIQLRTDLNLHLGLHYYRGPGPVDRDFLRSCGLSPWRRPWRGRYWFEPGRVPRRLRATRGLFTDLCTCGICPPNTRLPVLSPRAAAE
jgi:hypothetical protein